jgi:hypothetical protein
MDVDVEQISSSNNSKWSVDSYECGKNILFIWRSRVEMLRYRELVAFSQVSLLIQPNCSY